MKDHTAILKRELKEVQSRIQALEKATESKPDYGLGQGDPAITRWEMDKALLEQLKEKEKSIQLAISGSDQEAYGTCEECGQPIHPDRLAVLPDTRLCVRCAQNDQPD